MISNEASDTASLPGEPDNGESSPEESEESD